MHTQILPSVVCWPAHDFSNGTIGVIGTKEGNDYKAFGRQIKKYEDCDMGARPTNMKLLTTAAMIPGRRGQRLQRTPFPIHGYFGALHQNMNFKFGSYFSLNLDASEMTKNPEEDSLKPTISI
jgi:hypothetical protein